MAKVIPPLKPRDKNDGTRLVSEWYDVVTEQGNFRAYYHIFHGWMIKGEPEKDWPFGYKPLEHEVKNYV